MQKTAHKAFRHCLIDQEIGLGKVIYSTISDIILDVGK